MKQNTTTQKFSTEKVAAAAVRHAADCIDELVAKGEPMESRQTYRRGFNAGDPASTGNWNNEEARAETYDVTIEDTSNNNLYMARNGSYIAIGTQ